MNAVELLYVEDFQPLIQVMKEMRDECEPTIEFHDRMLLDRMFNCVNDITRPDFNCWIVKQNDAIVAFGVGSMRDFMFSPQRIASLLYWYVVPSARKTWSAFHILHTFEQWAKINGAIRIEVGAAKSIGDAAKINKMFARRGFTQYGELFFRDIGE